MYFKYNEEEDITEVWTETDDICVTCKYFDYCPLMAAFENNVVYPSANTLTIEECSMYELYIDEACEN